MIDTPNPYIVTREVFAEDLYNADLNNAVLALAHEFSKRSGRALGVVLSDMGRLTQKAQG